MISVGYNVCVGPHELLTKHSVLCEPCELHAFVWVECVRSQGAGTGIFKRLFVISKERERWRARMTVNVFVDGGVCKTIFAIGIGGTHKQFSNRQIVNALQDSYFVLVWNFWSIGSIGNRTIGQWSVASGR